MVGGEPVRDRSLRLNSCADRSRGDDCVGVAVHDPPGISLASEITMHPAKTARTGQTRSWVLTDDVGGGLIQPWIGALVCRHPWHVASPANPARAARATSGANAAHDARFGRDPSTLSREQRKQELLH
jgi:hypothetical protein